MCKKAKPVTQTSKQDLPQFVEDAGKLLVEKGTEIADKPFVEYDGQRVADFTGDQNTAFQQIRDLVAGAPGLTAEAMEGARNYASAPAQSVGVERIVDENGRLGSIANYMNPYVDQALEPALRKIMEASAQLKKGIAGSATGAGAFGDARHGIADVGLYDKTLQNIGDTSSNFMMNAFNNAMGQRTADRNAFMQGDQLNAGYNEAALSRELAGTGALQDRAQGELQLINALLGSGTQQQGNAQAGLDAAFAEFMRQQGWDFDTLGALGQALSGAPYEKTETTKKTGGSDNSGLGALGSMAAALITSI